MNDQSSGGSLTSTTFISNNTPTTTTNIKNRNYKNNNSNNNENDENSTDQKQQPQPQQQLKYPYNTNQVILIDGKTYGRKFTISKAYLDLEDPVGVKPSLHKFIHSNRILIFSLLLLYIAIDGKNHGIDKLIHHALVLPMIFINPFELLLGLTVMHTLSLLIPLFNYCYHRNKFNKWLFRNDNKKALFLSYVFVQFLINTYSAYFILYRQRYPLGTQFYLGLVCIVLCWKQHSYFIVTNYETLHKRINNKKDEKDDEFNKQLSNRQINYKESFPSFYDYGKDYLLFILTPTLIYDQYFEVKKVSATIPKESYKIRLISFLKELYSSLAIMMVAHYINVEYIFPPLLHKLDIYSYLKILIPAEINFQLQYYLLYHSALSLLADLTGFNDRLSFYNNYWDAVTTKEILTQWSKPVHNWLFRHVMSDMKSLFKLKTIICLFATMIISGMFHEVIVTSITKQICMPWSTFSLISCAMFIMIENKFPKLSSSKYYHLFVRVLLVVGHGLFYYAYYYFCFSSYDITCPKL